MQIVLTKTINKDKGLVRGATRDWPPRTITALSEQLGSRDWYKRSADLETSLNARALKGPVVKAAPAKE